MHIPLVFEETKLCPVSIGFLGPLPILYTSCFHPLFTHNLCLSPLDSIATSATDISERKIHLTSSQDYPQVAPLPLPANIDPNETITFSPERARDISSTEMQCHAAMSTSTYPIDVTCDQNAVDPHVHSYDCHGSVHLNTMQSNVPQPFSSGAQFRNHLNMSGGQWAQNGKFMSQHLQASHYTNLRQQVRLDWDKKGAFMPNRSFHCLIAARTSTNPDQYRQLMSQIQVMRGAYSTANGPTAPSQSGETNDEKKSPPKTESKQSKLKQAVKEYGATVLIFHISLSLASLGTFYALVSRYVAFVLEIDTSRVINHVHT